MSMGSEPDQTHERETECLGGAGSLLPAIATPGRAAGMVRAQAGVLAPSPGRPQHAALGVRMIPGRCAWCSEFSSASMPTLYPANVSHVRVCQSEVSMLTINFAVDVPFVRAVRVNYVGPSEAPAVRAVMIWYAWKCVRAVRRVMHPGRQDERSPGNERGVVCHSEVRQRMQCCVAAAAAVGVIGVERKGRSRGRKEAHRAGRPHGRR